MPLVELRSVKSDIRYKRGLQGSLSGRIERHCKRKFLSDGGTLTGEKGVQALDCTIRLSSFLRKVISPLRLCFASYKVLLGPAELTLDQQYSTVPKVE